MEKKENFLRRTAGLLALLMALSLFAAGCGEKPGDVRKWLVERYGDYVTYDPPWSPATALLWLAPLLLLGFGAWVARGSFKRRL